MCGVATFGTEILSNNVIKAHGNRRACLMANHGQVAVGAGLEQACALAHEVETLARLYTISLQIGKMVLLDDTEMDINLEKFKHYGKQHSLQSDNWVTTVSVWLSEFNDLTETYRFYQCVLACRIGLQDRL